MLQVDGRRIALFFFYAFLDETRAINAASEAVQNCKDRLAKNPELKPSVALVAATHHLWLKHKGHLARGRHNFSPESGWILPAGLDLGPWKEFQKTAQEDEFLALIWSRILQLPDEDIASGLGISVGTLQYRTGRALRKIGALTHPISERGAPSLGIVRE